MGVAPGPDRVWPGARGSKRDLEAGSIHLGGEPRILREDPKTLSAVERKRFVIREAAI